MKKLITLTAILFLSTSSYAQMGFGMLLKGEPSTGIQIDKVVEKSGAEIAGMQAGDILLSVNGKSFAGKNYIEATALLKAQPDKGNKLKFKRNGEEKEVTINKTPMGGLPVGASDCISGDCLNGKGKMRTKLSNGEYVYEGDFKNGKKEGKGIITYSAPYPVFETKDHPEARMELLKFSGDFVNDVFGSGDFYFKTTKGEVQFTGKLNSAFHLDGKYLVTELATKKKVYLTYENGEYITADEFVETKDISSLSKEQLSKAFITIWERPDASYNYILFPGIGNNYDIYIEEIGADTKSYTKGNGNTRIDLTKMKDKYSNLRITVLPGTGTFSGISFAYTISGDPKDAKDDQLWRHAHNYAIKEIVQWGNARFTTILLSGCTTVDITAPDIPDLSQLSSMTFNGCYNLKADKTPIAKWNVSNLKSMFSIFSSCRNFNQNISSWNTSNVTDMSFAFSEARKFNQPVENWNVNKVTMMQGMFTDAGEFNQPLNKWNVSKVISMNEMFEKASVFNQPLDKWNTSSLTDMGEMFNEAREFNQDLSSWKLPKLEKYYNAFQWSKVKAKPPRLQELEGGVAKNEPKPKTEEPKKPTAPKPTTAKIDIEALVEYAAKENNISKLEAYLMVKGITTTTFSNGSEKSKAVVGNIEGADADMFKWDNLIKLQFTNKKIYNTLFTKYKTQLKPQDNLVCLKKPEFKYCFLKEYVDSYKDTVYLISVWYYPKISPTKITEEMLEYLVLNDGDEKLSKYLEQKLPEAEPFTEGFTLGNFGEEAFEFNKEENDIELSMSFPEIFDYLKNKYKAKIKKCDKPIVKGTLNCVSFEKGDFVYYLYNGVLGVSQYNILVEKKK